MGLSGGLREGGLRFRGLSGRFDSVHTKNTRFLKNSCSGRIQKLQHEKLTTLLQQYNENGKQKQLFNLGYHQQAQKLNLSKTHNKKNILQN